MNKTAVAMQPKKQAVFSPPVNGVLQRKCSECGNHSLAGGECEACKKKRQNLQRRAANYGREQSEVPPIVHDVLRSPGQPLDKASRDFMEPRLGYDFSQVRVHTDSKAAASARAVGALAYTVGRNVVFDARQYTSGTDEGKRTLAHELTHVIQQEHASDTAHDNMLAVGPVNSNEERQADLAAERVGSGQSLGNVGFIAATNILQRKNGDPIEVDLVPSDPVPGVDLPKVSPETWRLIGGDADNAGKTLSEPEKAKIAAITKENAPTGSPLVFSEGPRFLLHDTAGILGAAKLSDEQKLGRGPLGAGVSAWVPRSTSAVIARPQLFEARRPSTSEFEKAADIIEQGPRETAFRQAWKASAATEQTNAVDRALDGLSLTAAELSAEKKSALSQLNAASGKIFTSAAWSVGEICSAVTAKGVKNVAVSPAKEADLSAGCNTLKSYFSSRASRVGSTVTVEILQESGLKKTKAQDSSVSENSCNPNNPNLKPLPKPAYTDSQYKEITMLYLRSSLKAGRFPEITTHFQVDAFKSGHCDPRCFDLYLLYRAIAGTLGHGRKSTYGVKPSYGTKWGTNNVWWDNTICGGGPPTI